MDKVKSYSFLTLHKAGSAFAAEIIRSLFQDNGWATFDPATEAFTQGLDEHRYIYNALPDIAAHSGFLGPFRSEPVKHIASLDAIRPIIHIRDPRDCLVSNYYSISFSHVLPGPGPERENFLRLRRACLSVGVDDFCLDILTNGDRSFQLLRSASEARPDAIISRYERMVDNFSDWLTDIVAELPIVASADKIASLHPGAVRPIAEDVYSHRRQVKPGDFRRKLRHDTQSRLTDFFYDDLIYFGYATDP